MATQWETYPVEIGGGLITSMGRLAQGVEIPGSARVLQNFEQDVRGGYTKILGYSRFSQSALPGTALIAGVVAIETSKVLAVRGRKIFSSIGGPWNDLGTISTVDILQRIHFNNFNFDGSFKYVIVGPNFNYVIYDVATDTITQPTIPTAVASAVEGAEWVSVFKNHVFFAKDNLLTFTEPYKYDAFDTGLGAGQINIGDKITGLIIFRDQLFVFCQSRIFRLSGNSQADFQLDPVTDKTGCISGHTLAEIGGDVMYLGPDGIRYLSASEKENDFGLSRASLNIQKDVTTQFANSKSYFAFTIPSKSQYRFFVFEQPLDRSLSNGFIGVVREDQTSNNIAWSTTKGIKVYYASRVQSGMEEAIFFSFTGSYVYRMESGNSFDGARIEAIFESPYSPVLDPLVRKTFYNLKPYLRVNGVIDITGQLKFDYGDVGSAKSTPFTIKSGLQNPIYGDPNTVYGTAVYGAAAAVQPDMKVNGSGFTVSWGFYDNSTNPSFNINYLVLEYRTNERK